jgi:hypothetical protein
LLEIKVTTRPLGPDYFQLIGYLLADTDDEFGLRRVGFLLPRIPALIAWPYGDVLCPTASAAPPALSEWRRRFASAVAESAETPGTSASAGVRVRLGRIQR